MHHAAGRPDSTVAGSVAGRYLIVLSMASLADIFGTLVNEPASTAFRAYEPTVDKSLALFAELYAAQNDRGYAALDAAVKRGSSRRTKGDRPTKVMPIQGSRNVVIHEPIAVT